ncbi:MAG: hypothetical protein DWQ10_00105 [Calditrichaeota bacterium]|nr:MAG: hypothetical protein DWQ10_00105 [Calditrichota bacterium]
MQKKYALNHFARAGIMILFSYCLSTPLFAQASKSIFVLPTYATNITSEKSLKISHELSAHILTRTEFIAGDSDSIRTFENAVEIKAHYTDDALIAIGSKVRADYLFIPEITADESSTQLKVSQYDVQVGLITKVVVQPCVCNPADISEFPFRRLLELLFDAPDFELTTEIPEEAPPALLPDMPVLIPPADTSSIEEQATVEGDSSSRRRGWKKYIASAVIAGGGVLYLTVMKNSDDGGSKVKLANPPNPPDNN